MPPLSVVDLPPTEFLTLGITRSRGPTPACWPPVPGPEASYRSSDENLSCCGGRAMEIKNAKLLSSLFFLTCILFLPCSPAKAQTLSAPARITQAVDENSL